MLFPRSVLTVRSFGTTYTDRHFEFWCIDDAFLLGRDRSGGFRTQVLDVIAWRLICKPPKIPRLITFTRIDVLQTTTEGVCSWPDPAPGESTGSNRLTEVDSNSISSIQANEELSTAESKLIDASTGHSGCAPEINPGDQVANLNRAYNNLGSTIDDWTLVGWVTDLTATTFLLPIKAVSWRESRPKGRLLRHPLKYERPSLPFNDIQSGFVYAFCGIAYTWQAARLHSSMFFKVGVHHKRRVAELAHLTEGAWHSLDSSGKLVEMPAALAKVFEDEHEQTSEMSSVVETQ